MDPSDKINILLVDDNQAKRTAIEAVLQHADYNLVKTESGREALRQLLQNEFAVLILDVNMPEMDGFELAGLIRQRANTQHTPILFVTNNRTADVDQQRGYALGAVDYLFTPIVPETLRSKVSVFVDLFRQRRELARLNQELQKKNAELAQLSDLKNQFLGMAAHDLRNPLGIVVNCSEMLLEETVGTLGEEHLQLVKYIETASRFMSALVNDLLDIAKIEAGKIDLDLQPTDLLAFLRHVVLLNQLLAKRKGIQIRLLDHELLPLVPLDAQKMEQVLNNLLSNAIKFSTAGTTVSIQARTCGDHVTVSVSDQGPGIPAQDLGKLFQLFSKTSVRAPGGEKSMGLGLAIVRKIVLGHQGEIKVDSEVGRGSTFRFCLPYDLGTREPCAMPCERREQARGNGRLHFGLAGTVAQNASRGSS